MREKVLYALASGPSHPGVEHQRHRPSAGGDPTRGDLQDHLLPRPMWICAMTAACAALLASVGFLATKNFKFDAAAVAVTEVGWLSRRPAWSPAPSGAVKSGAFVDLGRAPDFRAVCWLLYAGYLMLRKAVEDPRNAPRSPRCSRFSRSSTCPSWSSRSSGGVRSIPTRVLGGGSFPPDWNLHFVWNMFAMFDAGVVMVAVRLRQEDAQREIDACAGPRTPFKEISMHVIAQIRFWRRSPLRKRFFSISTNI